MADKEYATLKNLFKNQQEKSVNPTLDDLEQLIDSIYSKEENDNDVEHSKKIADYRLPIRISRGKSVIKSELIDEWVSFVTKYSNKDIPYNYELETILKYLSMISEGIYNPRKIANIFIEDVREITSPEKIFILTNIERFANMSISFYQLVNEALESRNNQIQDARVLEITNELIEKGISKSEAQVLAEAKIAKMIENGHEVAELMVFLNGSKEGIDNEGNWVFVEDVVTPSNRHFQIIFKTREGNQMRYIIDKDTNIALVTSKDGSFKDKIKMNVEIEVHDDINSKTLIEKIESIVTEIAVLDVSHDEAYETTREIIELINPSSEDVTTLKVEDIFNQEIPNLKKAHE